MNALKNHTDKLNFLVSKAHLAVAFPEPLGQPRFRRIDANIFMKLVLCAAISVLLFAAMTIAAHASTSTSIAPPSSWRTTFTQGGKSWWHFIADTGFWVCLAAGGLLYFIGLTQYIRWAVGGILIFALGGPIGKWIMTKAGFNVG